MKTHLTLGVLVACLLASAPALAMKKLFVGNLPYGTTSAEVKSLVPPFGSVMSIVVMSIDADGETWTDAEVAFDNPRSVNHAVRALDGMLIGGRTIRARAKKILVVGSKVKEVIREAGLRSDGELVQAISDKVHEMLEAATGRATSNGRSTVRPYDL